MPIHVPTVAFIGGGPRTAGLLERLAANRPEMFAGALDIHVVEPFSPGSGRIWRLDQDPGLLLNSMAGDVTMFTDASVVCEGPVADGPDLAQWAAEVAAGSLPDAPVLPPHLLAQAAGLGRSSFPTRQLHSAYLEWFFRRAVAALAPQASVTVHGDSATELAPGPAGGWLIRLAGGNTLAADVAVLALGHSDAEVHGRSAEFADFAARHGAFHAAPAYTTDVDYSALAPGQDVIVSGMGLAFIDLLVLLMEGRGGQFVEKDCGGLDYLPSGREPRLWAGSRRGVPYHSKISAELRGHAPGPARFLSPDAVSGLLAGHSELDFRTQLWPLMAKEAAHAYYLELFTGSPERVAMDWAGFSASFARLDWNSAGMARLVAAAVPDPALRLDFESLDHPLEGTPLERPDSIAAAVVAHIERDLNLRDGGENPETLALFLGLLRVYMDVASIVPAHRLTAASQAAVHSWWHGFFSFMDSGPPPHRLRQVLALHRAGLLEFLGPGLGVHTQESTGLFVARHANGSQALTAAAFIEARLPAPTVANSANPLLAHLHASSLGSEQLLLTADGTVSTGRLLVTAEHRLVGRSGEPAEGLFAVGPGTSAWASGAFARPGSNAAPFRENDALARKVLHTLTAHADLALLSGRTQS
ncbi:FAD/NAD(P)-binding protein [Arthrobacter sp. HY1533]|uniref:FAD/NAD(P)-binding protein n=1 Tax=Arthrobacter sp. HY1533 TaxID=2970919 RepID=UPI0022B9E1BB|nr:FAD/NAD(P)-binding domain-containing protein [Arthrobacter sp. HY1533]